jgi:hypothetical protein
MNNITFVPLELELGLSSEEYVHYLDKLYKKEIDGVVKVAIMNESQKHLLIFCCYARMNMTFSFYYSYSFTYTRDLYTATSN